MDSEDDETLEYDIEVVESPSISLISNSIDENSNQPDDKLSNQQVSNELPVVSLVEAVQQDKLDASDGVQGAPEAREEVDPAASVLSDEERYAELIKEMGEFKLVEVIPSQSDTATESPPEPPQSLVDENQPSNDEGIELQLLEPQKEEVRDQVDLVPPDGLSERDPKEVTKLDEEAEEVFELAPTIEEANEDNPAEEKASSATEEGPKLEEPSANDIIPLDETENSMQVKLDDQLIEVASQSEPQLPEQLPSPDDPVTETEQVAQPIGNDVSGRDGGHDDLTVTNASSGQVQPISTEPAEISEDGDPQISEQPTEDDVIVGLDGAEPQSLSELDVCSEPQDAMLRPSLPSLESPTAIADAPALQQQPPTIEATIAPISDDSTLELIDHPGVAIECTNEGDAVLETVELMEEEATKPESEEAIPQLITEIEHTFDMPGSDHVKQEIILEVADGEPVGGREESNSGKGERQQVNIIIDKTENPKEVSGSVAEDELLTGQSGNSESFSFTGSEDLEWEFDNEPAFERRQIQVKQGCNPRTEYKLGEELGRGKFGTVYRCVEHSSGREFAAKFVHMRRKEDREDVEREIKIMSLLQHKRLLQLYDALDDGKNEMCLITELVEGGELFERIVDDDFELTEKKAAIFMRQICEGVDYMHSQSIVHLDMKPENILCVSKTGNRIKLIDFGLARQLNNKEPLRVMFGTPDFAAPEVLAYDTVSFATDMWSVGVICYVLLSGLSPFMGDNDLETMANVTRATFDFEDASFDPISDLAKDFISKLLVTEQSERIKPRECLKHPWLQRGGVQLEASVRGRRESMQLAASQDAQPDQVGPIGIGAASTPPLLVSLDKRNLKKYVVRRKWHKTVHAIMALGRMGANLKSRSPGD